MMRSLLLGVLIIFCNSVIAQRECLTPTPDVSKQTSPFVTNHLSQQDTVADAIIYIPVVVHVLYNQPEHNISDAQIISQIDALNRDFALENENRSNIPEPFQALAADTRIRFCLAKVDPQGRPTNGIVRKYTSVNPFLGNDAMKFSNSGGDDAWDATYYLNIWVCNLFGRSLGYSSVPGFSPDRDGLVIKWDVFGTIGNLRANYNQGRTVTHEVGHWLGLKHIWGDGICVSDDIDDTPPQKSYNSGCPSFPKLSDCSIDGHGDMYMNYMDLTDDACMSMFTHGQKIRMRSQFAVGGYRNEMLNAFACDSTRAVGAPLPTEVPVEEPASVQFNIYPNPTTGLFFVETKENTASEVLQLQVYNIQGNEVLRKQLVSEKETVELSQLPSGVYLVRITGEHYKKIFKLLKR
jgi:hypothetical protein